MKTWLPKPLSLLVFIAYVFNHCFTEFVSYAQVIPEDEVKTLQIISNKMSNQHWKNISQNSCNDEGRSFNKTFNIQATYSNVTCDCSFKNDTICHVIYIILKGLNLTGVLPAELGDLPQLRVLDLSRNYITGQIPPSLSKIPLTNLSLVANHNSGSIPNEIGQISTLIELNVEDNQLGGPLPATLGNLKNLKRMVLAGNYFNGVIPETFSNLTNLVELRISGNNISGAIPDFIGNFANLNKLHIIGTSMQGPIPSSFSLLTNLNNLMISDLINTKMEFPNMSSLINLDNLVLRNCLIADQIPDYIQKLTKDLSYNQLKGPVPEPLNTLKYMFLTNNSLSGTLPTWMYRSDINKYYDLSYNNFTGSLPSTSNCQRQSWNLISSFSTEEINSDKWCLIKNLPCTNKPKYDSLFINCGGGKMNFQGNVYEEDTSPDGSSTFVAVEQRWAYSSTGAFINKRAQTNFFVEIDNTTNPIVTSIYQTARIAPISLKYYGLCLKHGSYNVKLHFAEIIFFQGYNFSSNGRRIFDVAIQGNIVLKDFNIAVEAGGARKEIIKEFNVHVKDTLEIQLYWAGKGTTNIPVGGTYGPLISGITVTSNSKRGLSAGAITGIVLASLTTLVLVLVILRKKGYLGNNKNDSEELERLNTGYFSLRQIKNATDNFSIRKKIGEGGFGPVYKGVLVDGRVVAVKQLSSKSKQGNREFVNEIGMISALNHPNLVKLYGCCIEGKELLLVYEYMENNSLANALFGDEDKKMLLNWQTRKIICLGIARGLAYLHEGSRLKIVHRDIKATNILLDKDLNAKISDFGLAKLDEEGHSHINTRIAGTVGYMAPEYATRGYLTDKADVYSFGVVVLEIISGKNNTNYRPKEEAIYLLDLAYVLQEEEKILDLVDPTLGSNYSQEEASMLLNLALLCTNQSPTLRPKMSSVVSIIDGQDPSLPLIVKSSGINKELRFKALTTLSQANQADSPSTSMSFQVEKSISTDYFLDSSISMQSKDDNIESAATYKLLIDS